jgi:hypothetical protein
MMDAALVLSFPSPSPSPSSFSSPSSSSSPLGFGLGLDQELLIPRLDLPPPSASSPVILRSREGSRVEKTSGTSECPEDNQIENSNPDSNSSRKKSSEKGKRRKLRARKSHEKRAKSKVKSRKKHETKENESQEEQIQTDSMISIKICRNDETKNLESSWIWEDHEVEYEIEEEIEEEEEEYQEVEEEIIEEEEEEEEIIEEEIIEEEEEEEEEIIEEEIVEDQEIQESNITVNENLDRENNNNQCKDDRTSEKDSEKTPSLEQQTVKDAGESSTNPSSPLPVLTPTSLQRKLEKHPTMDDLLSTKLAPKLPKFEKNRRNTILLPTRYTSTLNSFHQPTFDLPVDPFSETPLMQGNLERNINGKWCKRWVLLTKSQICETPKRKVGKRISNFSLPNFNFNSNSNFNLCFRVRKYSLKLNLLL